MSADLDRSRPIWRQMAEAFSERIVDGTYAPGPEMNNPHNGDTNSYPHPGTEAGPPLPVLEKIADHPHRLHRSYLGAHGHRLLDTRPDEALRTAGIQDIARYWATTAKGNKAAVSRTVNACATHGPDSRVDRPYATTTLLPAVTGVDVIEVPLELSDHHIVRTTLDGDTLSDILNTTPKTTR